MQATSVNPNMYLWYQVLAADEADDVVRSDRCFVCGQDGQLVLCDFPGCVQVYHQVRSPYIVSLQCRIYICMYVYLYCLCTRCVWSRLSLRPPLQWMAHWLYRAWRRPGVSPYPKGAARGFAPDTTASAAAACRRPPAAFTAWICPCSTISSIGVRMTTITMTAAMTMVRPLWVNVNLNLSEPQWGEG